MSDTTLRARQMLDDPTLAANQRDPNATALLKQLARNCPPNSLQRADMLASIGDADVRAAMAAALDGR